ncbi:MAG: hypothetical protein ACO2O4_03815 [Minisyncoccia bacterium]|jgi:hypothetical protein
MNPNNLYLIKGKINYKGKEYDFKTLKLVRLNDLTQYNPIDLKVFSEFNFNEVYLFDEKNNFFIPDFDNEYNVNVSGTYIFSIYSSYPILAVVSTMKNTDKVFLSVLSKSLFHYEIEKDPLNHQSYNLLLYKYNFIKVETTGFTDFSIIFYDFKYVSPRKFINQNQIFDWDIIELC